jgi:hypothetical protein
MLWLCQALLFPTIITFSNRYCAAMQQRKSVITVWNQCSRFVNLKWFCHFSASNLNSFSRRVTHQLYIGISCLIENGLCTGLPLMTAKILTIIVSVTRGKYLNIYVILQITVHGGKIYRIKHPCSVVTGFHGYHKAWYLNDITVVLKLRVSK